jgi:hypothetical protein
MKDFKVDCFQYPLLQTALYELAEVDDRKHSLEKLAERMQKHHTNLVYFRLEEELVKMGQYKSLEEAAKFDLVVCEEHDAIHEIENEEETRTWFFANHPALERIVNKTEGELADEIEIIKVRHDKQVKEPAEKIWLVIYEELVRLGHISSVEQGKKTEMYMENNRWIRPVLTFENQKAPRALNLVKDMFGKVFGGEKHQ